MWNRIHQRPYQTNRILCTVDLRAVQTGMDDILDYAQNILLSHLGKDVVHVFELYNPSKKKKKIFKIGQ